MKHLLAALLPLALTVGCASAKPQPAAKPAPTPKMKAPEKMDDEVRQHFKTVMTQHGDDMTVLMWSILFLDVDGAADATEELKQMKWLERPKAGDEAKLDVPPLIYDIQDELLAKADKLSEIARSGVREPEVLATAFGDVANACVKCHSYYLYTTGPRRGDTAPEPERTEGD